MISPDLLCAGGEPSLSLNPMRLPADGNLHGVVLGINEKTGLLKGCHNGNPDMEPFHTLKRSQNLSV